MIKLIKLEIDENFLNLAKVLLRNSTAYIIINDETLRQEEGKDAYCHHFYST